MAVKQKKKFIRLTFSLDFLQIQSGLKIMYHNI
jgi:hypothetical protein